MTLARAARLDRDTLVAMRRVRDRMDRDYAQPLDLEALARMVHRAPGTLSRQFRAAYGETPYRYLMTRRIERAMLLLRRGDCSVTDVGLAVGWQSLGTFSTRFAEVVGVPPSVYRDEGAPFQEGMPPCIVRMLTRPVRNREAASEPALVR
jgi:AraC-like DNA-binding protein